VCQLLVGIRRRLLLVRLLLRVGRVWRTPTRLLCWRAPPTRLRRRLLRVGVRPLLLLLLLIHDRGLVRHGVGCWLGRQDALACFAGSTHGARAAAAREVCASSVPHSLAPHMLLPRPS
jgi:hypothetical protein